MKPLSLAQLEELLDLHGAQLERWPHAEAQAAQALLASDPKAQALLSQAQEVESLLGEIPITEPSAQLRTRIAQIPAQHPHKKAFWPSLRELLAPSAALAACFATGLLLGGPLSDAENSASTEVANNELPESEYTASTSEDSAEEQWEELLALAMADNLEADLAGDFTNDSLAGDSFQTDEEP